MAAARQIYRWNTMSRKTAVYISSRVQRLMSIRGCCAAQLMA